MVDKRICAVSLSREEPIMVLSGYRDGQLHIIKSEPLTPNIGLLKKTLPDRLKKMSKAGFIVIVDEILTVFSRYGQRVRLDTIGSDNRPVLVSTLEVFKNMRALKAITFPATDSGSFDIPDSVVDERRDLSGKATYHIDWESLTSKQVALLLCIHAATSDNIAYPESTRSLLKLLGARSEKTVAKKAFPGICRAINESLAAPDRVTNPVNEFGIPIFKGGSNE